jgi:hypothetical protein
MATKLNFTWLSFFIVSLLSWWTNVLCVMEDTAMNEDRKVIPAKEVSPDIHEVTNEDLEKEYAYALATKLIKGMLDAGIITQDEYAKIDTKNRESFPSFFAQLMP